MLTMFFLNPIVVGSHGIFWLEMVPYGEIQRDLPKAGHWIGKRNRGERCIVMWMYQKILMYGAQFKFREQAAKRRLFVGYIS